MLHGLVSTCFCQTVEIVSVWTTIFGQCSTKPMGASPHCLALSKTGLDLSEERWILNNCMRTLVCWRSVCDRNWFSVLHIHVFGIWYSIVIPWLPTGNPMECTFLNGMYTEPTSNMSAVKLSSELAVMLVHSFTPPHATTYPINSTKQPKALLTNQFCSLTPLLFAMNTDSWPDLPAPP
jgi:hypothetical protein